MLGPNQRLSAVTTVGSTPSVAVRMDVDAPSSFTAETMALQRAFESHRPAKSRLFTDPYADAFLRPWMRWLAAASAVRMLRGAATGLFDAKTGPGPRPSAIIRTRVIDDALVDIVNRHHQITALDADKPDKRSQVVVLGAGFDTRAYRLSALAAARVFELDHPSTQRAKRRVIDRLGLSSDHVTHAPINFEHDDLLDVLTNAGIDPYSPIVFLWEGVTNYLSARAVEDTLATIRRLLGSRHAALIVTYVDIRALDDPSPFPEARRWTEAVRNAGEPWTFGLHPSSASQYFRDRGYLVRSDVSTKDAGRQLLRGLHRTEQGSALYRVLVADITPLT
jgi:methyltransferase (TIGR00027 family)